ncbi:PIN domain nuclease of toxin-antitoxin system [Streptacidiphilus sp. MAP5-52]
MMGSEMRIGFSRLPLSRLILSQAAQRACTAGGFDETWRARPAKNHAAHGTG